MSLDKEKVEEILAKLAKFDEFEKSITLLSDKYDELLTDYKKLKVDHSKLDKENRSLKTQLVQATIDIEKIKDDVNDLEQYSRRDCLEIRGIPYTQDEDTDEIVKQVGDLIDVELVDNDISVSHRLPTYNKTSDGLKRDPAIIVKFTRRSDRDELYQAKKKLKNKTTKDLGLLRYREQPIFISESLTSRNRKIFNLSLQKKKELRFQFIWSSYGKTFLRKDGNSPIISIKNEDDLGKLSRIT